MRILIAEDDPTCRRLLQATLSRWSYDVVAVSDGSAALDELQQPHAPRLAVLDWQMPGMDGPHVCQAIRALPSRSYTYLMLLTSRNRKEDLVEGLELGADDYLVKPVDLHELKARLKVAQRILDLQNRLMSACEALRDQALRDPLTGLLNHGAILEILEQEVDRASRENCPVGVIIADLDHFKQINDSYGHPAGDAVLRETSRRIRSVIRRYDAAGRYGGEEFLMVLPGCDHAVAEGLAERLRESLAELPVEFDGQLIPISASMGVALGGLEGGYDPAILFAAADAALYRAKQTGRNRVVVANPANSLAAAG
jgi:diguanylate cyclase (GGDEF)-like protein